MNESPTLGIDTGRIVKEELDALRDRIIRNHIAAGQRTTGKTADSLDTVVTGSGGNVIGTLCGRGYFATLETGTRPWRMQHFIRAKDGSTRPSAPKWFVDIIRDWIIAKHINAQAFGVATRIMTEGSRLFRNGGREDIYSNEIPVALRNISDRIGGLYEAQMIASIMRNENRIKV